MQAKIIQFPRGESIIYAVIVGTTVVHEADFLTLALIWCRRMGLVVSEAPI
jgi:hypothetical protein